jgi:hypothetical protein
MNTPNPTPTPLWTPTVSILLNNYNYGDYVATAIESALAQDYPHVEIVVVDDGSTDHSWSVIEGYRDQVRVIRQENAGHGAAGRTGLASSTGEIVMFLDSDDFLFPTAASRVVAAWQPGCAKVQFRLSLVDPTGAAFGTDPPWSAEMPSGDLVPQLVATGSYVSPVTSGNAFPRELLERLMPFPPDLNDLDHYLNTVVPLHGRVLSIDDELGAYRQHTRNRWAFSGGVDAHRIRQRVRVDLLKEQQLRSSAVELGIVVPPDRWQRDTDHLLHRLGSLRLDPAGHPQPDDRILPLLRLGLRAVGRAPDQNLIDRAYLVAVFLAVAVLPRAGVAQVLRFAVGGARPEWLRRLVRMLRGRRASASEEKP